MKSKIYSAMVGSVRTLTLLTFIITGLINTAKAQNMGFEATAATPPTGWVPVTLVWSHNTNATFVRTGGNSMTVTDPATSGSTIGCTNGFVTTASAGNFLITIAWGKSNTAANASFYVGYRTGSTNTLNPSTTTTPPAQYVLNNTTWTRISSASAATVAAGSYGPALRAFRQTSTTGTQVYMDDFMIYGSPSNVPDLTAPNPAVNATIAGNTLDWINGTDNGAPASGISGVTIIRTDGVSIPAPTLNDQAMYSTVNGTAGTSSFVNGANTWTVVANIAGNGTTNFTDATAGSGPYTYVIYMRDLAYNYSTGTTVTAASPCTDPPTAGTFAANPAGMVCVGSTVTLNLTGGTGGLSQTFQWFSDPSSVGSFSTPVSGVQSSSFVTINPTSSLYYRCEIICSGGTPVYSTPGQVLVNTGITGTYLVGSSQVSPNFTTLTAAVAAYNSCPGNGPVVFELTDALYGASETFPLVINASPFASAANTLTIRPSAGVASTISGTSGAGVSSLIQLNGADFVTFDGLNTGGASLTIENTSATTGTAVFWLSSNGAGAGARNNTIKNCSIKGGIGQNTSALVTFGIVVAGSTLSATLTSVTAGDDNDNTLITGNAFTKLRYCIFTRGGATTNPNTGTTITNNIMGPAAFGADEIGKSGVLIREETGAVISGNEIRFVGGDFANTSAGSDRAGICFGTDASWTPTTVFVTNTTVTKNKIHDIVDERTFSAVGIIVGGVDGTNPTGNIIANNFIAGLKGNGTATDQTLGIGITSGNGDKVVHNSINLYGDTDPNASAATPTQSNHGIRISATTVTNLVLKNNIIFNDLSSSSAVATVKNACIDIPASFVWGTGGSNNNDLYVNTGNPRSYTGSVGNTAGTFHLSLANWQAATSQDANSLSIQPVFASSIDLHLTPASNVGLNDFGTPIGGVTDDIDGDSRSGSTPDMGADEFSVSAGLDIGAFDLVTPATTGCYSNVQTIVIKVKNYGSAIDFSSNPATVTCNVTGTASATLTGTLTGTLAVNADVDVLLTGTFDMSTNGTYTFNAFTTCATDGSSGNDAMAPKTRTRVPVNGGSVASNQIDYCLSGAPTLTSTGSAGGPIQWQSSTVSASGPWTNVGTGTATYLPGTITQTTYFRVDVSCLAASTQSNVVTVTVSNPSVTGTTNGNLCGTGTTTISATPSAGATINWYTAASGGAPVGTGNNFTTPVISSTTNYWASASIGGNTFNLGLPNRVGTTTNSGFSDVGLMFDAVQAFTLNSVAVYAVATTPSGNATGTIALKNSAGTIIQSTTFSVPTAVSPGVKTVVPLNFNVPIGNQHRLVFTAASGGGLTGFIRESATGYVYPYTFPGVASITSAYTAGASSAFYYYFYDWSISAGCESARTMVTANVVSAPAITASTTLSLVCSGGNTTLNVSSSNPDYDYTWTPGNLTGTSVSVNPAATTTYTVTAVDISGGTFDGCTELATVNITAQPASATLDGTPDFICGTSGSSTISLTPSTGYPAGSLQWQDSPDNVTYTDIGGATSATYTTPTISSDTYYKVLIKDGNNNTCLQPFFQLVITNPQVTSTTPASRCGIGTVNLAATAPGGTTINWYAAASGGISLGTGTSFTTPVISNSTTYYAGASTGGTTANVGLPAAVTTTSSGSGTTNFGLVFDVFSTFELQTVKIYPVSATSASGTVIIDVINGAGTIMHTATVNVTGSPSGSVVPQTVTLNFIIAPGTNYKLRPRSFTGISGLLFEPSAGAPPSGNYGYPFTIPGVVSILTSTLTAAPTNTPRNDLYYYFYNWQVSTGCEGARVGVLATVNTAPAITVTPTVTTCSNVSANLTVTSPNDPDYTYTWTPGNLTGGSITVNPATTTTYTVNAIDNTAGPNAGCTNIGTVLVNVNEAPPTPVITPASALLCEDDTVKLKIEPSANQYAFGTQANQNTAVTTAPGFPAPYTVYYGAQRMQMLIRASELIASGYGPGSSFTNIQFPVVSMGSNWGGSLTSCNSFQVKIGQTASTTIAAFQAGLTTVVSPANFTPVVGYSNTHTFSTPFIWNGTDNIIIETTFGNNILGGANDLVVHYNSPTSYQSCIVYRADNVTAAAAATTTTVSFSYSARPDFKLNGTAQQPSTWSPVTDLFEDEDLTIPYTGTQEDSVYAHPSQTRTYTATNISGGCTSSASVTVTVDVIPQVNIVAAGPTTYCPGSTVTLNASTDPSYTNYAWTPGGPSGPGATSFTVGGATNTTTIYRITATGAGGCTSHQDIPVQVYDTVSPTITVIGSPTICTNQTTTDLQADIVGPTGPATSYSWSTTETTALITVSTGGVYSVVTEDIHNCFTHQEMLITESAAPAAPIVSPAGPINLCSSDGGATYSSATLTVNNYSTDLLWSTSETTASIIVDYADNFFVIYTDPSSGCFSTSNSVVTNALLASDAPTGVTSNANFNNICLGNTVTLSVDGGSLGDGADWQWFEGSCSGTPRGTGSSVTLTPTSGGIHTYYVKAVGTCNTTTCASISILVSTAPPPFGSSIFPSPVSGCNGTTAVMSGPVVSGASYYNWSCPQGGVLFNGNPGPVQTATPSVTVTFVSAPPAGASGYSICMFAGNGCGQSQTFCRFVRAKVNQPAAMSGSNIACANTNATYSVPAVVGADTYTWTVTGNATINGGGTTLITASNSITVNFTAGWSSGTLSVYASLSCGYNSAPRNLFISSTPAIPGTMSGPGYVCPGSSSSFSVAVVPGASSYNWTTSVPGAVISPSSNSASILFPAVIPAGSSVCVTAVSSCGNASAQRCKSIANGIPSLPGAISGPTTGQCTQSGVSYSITPVAQATGYLWTATGGATVSGPNNLSAVSINFPLVFTTCTLSVVATNACGSGAARTLIVAGAPAQPGVISGNQSVCVGAVETYSTPGSAGATSYNWQAPAGATILSSPPYGASILIQWGSTGGNVSVNAINDCGTSINRNLSVAVTCRQSQVSEALETSATLYPNPTGGKTTLQFESATEELFALNVLDVTGRVILSEEITAVEGINMHELDLSRVAKGIYLIRLESKNSPTQLLKVTVE